MATSDMQVMAKRVKGGSFLTEERHPQDVFTPEDFSEEHRQIAKTAIDFTQNEVLPAAAEIEAKNFAVTSALLRKAGELGLMAVDIPEAYGGLEMDKVTSALVAESISKLASFSVAFSAHVGIGTLPIVWYGTEAQKRKVSAEARHRRMDRRLCPLRILLRQRRHELPHPRRARRPTASTTSSTARRCGSPTAASPTCSPSSPRSMARSSPPS